MSRSKSNRPKNCPYVGKGGLKLEFALEKFDISADGCTCADLGCNVGGFTDCLLQHKASKVYAVDTSYGLLEWKLRIDPRVEVWERKNVLHWDPPEQLDLVAADLGWTKQELVLPVIERILRPHGYGLSLIKPQYERKEWTRNGIFPEGLLPDLISSICAECPPGIKIIDYAQSPYVGNGGNIEYWLFVEKN